MKRTRMDGEGSGPVTKRPKGPACGEAPLTVLECQEIAQKGLGLPPGLLKGSDIAKHRVHPVSMFLYSQMEFEGPVISHRGMCVTVKCISISTDKHEFTVAAGDDKKYVAFDVRDKEGIRRLVALVAAAFFNLSRGRMENVFTLQWDEVCEIRVPLFTVNFARETFQKRVKREDILSSDLEYCRLAANEYGNAPDGYDLRDRTVRRVTDSGEFHSLKVPHSAWIDDEGSWWLQLPANDCVYDRRLLMRSKVRTDHHEVAPPPTGWRIMEGGKEGDDVSDGITVAILALHVYI